MARRSHRLPTLRGPLDERLPPGAGWWFTLGSVLLFGLGVQVVTGIGLALHAPTPDRTWDSVRLSRRCARAFCAASIIGAQASW